MSRIYTTPLPKSQITRNDEATQARVQQSGLLEEGGTATEKIASENIDVSVDGVIRFGSKFSEKLSRELESLGESKYEALPFFDPDIVGGGPSAGYYEVERVDVSPVQSAVTEVYEYSVGLAFNETRESAWRAIATNEEAISTGLATGSSSQMGIPALASKARWFDASNGTEPATAVSTVSAEFGDVDLYDPDNATASDPFLLYEIAYSDESPVDVRVYDTRGLSKYYTVNAQDFNQWTHAYHTSFEFSGNPLVDNGLIRLEFDEPNGVVEASEWNNTTSTWDAITVNHGDYQLVDADFELITPSEVRVYTEWYHTVDDRLEQALLSFQRGLAYGIARYPSGTTQTSELETVLDPFVGDYATDVKPTQTLKARGIVK